MTFDSMFVATLAAILLTLVAHVSARVLARKLSWLPMVITAINQQGITGLGHPSR